MGDFEDMWLAADSQYKVNVSELQSILKVLPSVSVSQSEDFQRQARDCLGNIEQALTDLTQSLRTNRSSTSNQQYRNQINIYRKQYTSLTNSYRESLQKLRNSTHSMHEREERNRLLQSHEIIDSTQSALDRSKQVVAETEEVAIDSSTKVNAQGQQLENVLGDVHDINDTSARGRRIMMGMARRMMTDRIIQSIIVILELGIIGGLLYWRFSR
mmetsp:Transcript_23405/g.37455  ORF Transcript_23405/g.37455 Transcript_23405/m.37455 type:complete len:214 (+) Transcript_23405:51-692(+)